MLIRWIGREMRLYEQDHGTPSGGAAVDPPPTPEPPPAAVAASDGDDFDKDRAMATIKQLRAFEKDAKTKIKRLEELEASEQQRKDADLSELEKIRKQLTTLEAQHQQAQAELRSARIRDAARAAADDLKLAWQVGALDDAVKLGLFADLEIGDDGKVAGLNAHLKELHKARPYLFAAAVPGQAPDINAGGRGNGAHVLTDEERQAASRRYRSTF